MFYGRLFYCRSGGHWIKSEESGLDSIGRITCKQHHSLVRTRLMESRRKIQDRQKRKLSKEAKFKRFCRVCKRQTYDWYCCGERTGRVNLQSMIGAKIK